MINERVWTQIFRHVFAFTWRWRNIDRFLLEFSLVLRGNRLLPAESGESKIRPQPKPKEKQKSKTHSFGNYNFTLDGENLVIDCVDFVVVVDRSQRIVEVEGGSVLLTCIWQKDANMWAQRGMTTTNSQIKRRPNNPTRDVEIGSLSWDSHISGYRLDCRGIRLGFSREKRIVQVIGAAVKASVKGQVVVFGDYKADGPLFTDIKEENISNSNITLPERNVVIPQNPETIQ